MRTKKVIRYYCDFCNKGMFRSPSMKHHEEVCTKNINRFCGICNDLAGKRNFIKLIEEFKTRCKELYNLDEFIGLKAEKESLDWLKNEVDGCPACMLTVLRLGKIYAIDFDYKKQHEDFWHEKNEAERAREEFSTY